MKNFITGKLYKGKNIDRLRQFGDGDTEFCTFLQGVEQGYKLRKGSKGIPLIAFKRKKWIDPANPKSEPKTLTIKNCFIVFKKSDWN